LGDKIKRNIMGGAYGMYGRYARCIQGYVRGTEEKRLLGGHRRRWEESIKMDIKKVSRGIMALIFLAQDRDTCACECGNELSGSIKRGEFLE
jgi:hypothetical protein